MKQHTAKRTSPADPAPPPAPTLDGLNFLEGIRLHQEGQFDKAEALYRAAVALNPQHAEAHYNLGVLLHGQGRQADAINAYRDAIFARIDYVDAYGNLATVLRDQGKKQEAEILFRQALAYDPYHAMANCNLGVLLNDIKRSEEALAYLRRAIIASPDYPWSYVNLAPALLDTLQQDASIETCRRAVAVMPDMALGHYNLAAALKAENRLDESVASFRDSLRVQPDFGEAHFALGQVLLMQGQYKEGWREYGERWTLRDYTWLRDIHGPFEQPRWRGEKIAGKTILIYAEQGMGDAIQYARFIPRLAKQVGKIVLAVHPPLIPLFDGAFAKVDVVALDKVPLPPFDVHCPLLGLPEIFETDASSIPADIPYLGADPAKTERWRKRIGGAGLRVGVVWAGNPTQNGDRWRSPRLAAIAPLFSVPGVEFVALQKGPGREDLQKTPLPGNVLDLGDEIGDFADTAAIMAGLDLVITSCTAPLHLAGALGVPTWALIPFAPHFLWQLDRSDSPWYPSLRLYRQDKAGGDWSGAVGRLSKDLAAMVAERRTAGSLAMGAS